MKRFYLLGFAALAVCDTTSQVAFKLASQRAGAFAFAAGWARAALFSPWTYVAVAAYLGAFALWMLLLERAPVGPAFAASHIDVVTVLLVSVPLFGERLTAYQLAGAACIIAGIVCLSRAETADAHSEGDALAATAPAPPPGSRVARPAR